MAHLNPSLAVVGSAHSIIGSYPHPLWSGLWIT
jgi:hypothetical protein